ncbi:MAG: hypothetical protein H7Z72_24060, partial [Bacteroidetes bacterium]|nr:hypothetical protein [Fibrella sp.]
FSALVGRLDKSADALQGIGEIRTLGERFKSYGVGPYVTAMLGGIKEQRSKLNDEASVNAIDQALTAISAK